MGLDISYTDKLEKVPEDDVPSGVRGYTDDYYKWEEKSPHSLALDIRPTVVAAS